MHLNQFMSPQNRVHYRAMFRVTVDYFQFSLFYLAKCNSMLINKAIMIVYFFNWNHTVNPNRNISYKINIITTLRRLKKTRKSLEDISRLTLTSLDNGRGPHRLFSYTSTTSAGSGYAEFLDNHCFARLMFYCWQHWSDLRLDGYLRYY